ncbi:uncharacterized protein LOC125328255 [Corvus hawaiiensis]|uniref:uncharacterized protein LOC125328255 n=1 Tax=Corvus hawaiiensis TaxID=134902 RepID=UPI002018483E|nr:uncharacterized protein LOC125328255 [Corvus hawaiiensis]
MMLQSQQNMRKQLKKDSLKLFTQLKHIRKLRKRKKSFLQNWRSLMLKCLRYQRGAFQKKESLFPSLKQKLHQLKCLKSLRKLFQKRKLLLLKRRWLLQQKCQRFLRKLHQRKKLLFQKERKLQHLKCLQFLRHLSLKKKYLLLFLKNLRLLQLKCLKCRRKPVLKKEYLLQKKEYPLPFQRKSHYLKNQQLKNGLKKKQRKYLFPFTEKIFLKLLKKSLTT